MPYREPPPNQVPLRDAHRLEAAMKRANLSGVEVSHLAGVSRQTISKLRRQVQRTASAGTAEAIESALGVRRGHLFNYTSHDARGGLR